MGSLDQFQVPVEGVIVLHVVNVIHYRSQIIGFLDHTKPNAIKIPIKFIIPFYARL